MFKKKKKSFMRVLQYLVDLFELGRGVSVAQLQAHMLETMLEFVQVNATVVV